jgi:hypothetical protein
MPPTGTSRPRPVDVQFALEVTRISSCLSGVDFTYGVTVSISLYLSRLEDERSADVMVSERESGFRW